MRLWPNANPRSNTFELMRRHTWQLLGAAMAWLLAAAPACADPAALSKQIDAIVAAQMQRAPMPGVAVAVVRGEQVLHQRGYGLADNVSGVPVTEQTLFKMGSISKSMAALALGLLVDEGRLNWTDPLSRFIPELQMANPLVAALTVQQVLSHHTGLNLDPLEALMWPQPNSSNFSHFVAGITAMGDKLRDAPVFRYSNLNYLLAGEVLRRISGLSYRRFVEQRIFKPLGMHCVGGGFDAAERPLAAQSHLLQNGQWQRIRVDADTLPEGLDAAAGGVRCDVTAMARWLQLQLRGPGKQLPISAKTWRTLHTGLVVTRTEFNDKDQPEELETYGLGLQIKAGKNGVRWDHYGGVAGAVAYFLVVPDADLGLAVMINGNAAAGRNELVEQLLALLMPDAAAKKPTPVAPASAAAVAPPLQRADRDATRRWRGHYSDPWFGAVRICEGAGDMVWTTLRSPRLSGRLRVTADQQVAVVWDDPAVDSDSRLQIQTQAGGVVSAFKVLPLVSPEQSDFDFSALLFKRVGNCETSGAALPN